MNRQRMRGVLVWTVWIVLESMGALAQAENRALLVGIGSGYQAAGIQPLTGPEKDVELAQGLARQWGFSAIKVLRNGEATRDAMLKGLQWVSEGVRDGERALVYFSGHGTRVPRQTSYALDGCTAALVPVDGRSQERFLLADEFNARLQALRKRARVLLVVDACFSGSITKDLEGADLVKYYESKSGSSCDMAVNIKSLEAIAEEKSPVEQSDQGQLVALTATAANEIAWADLTRSGRGSLFTQALADLVAEGQTQSMPLTFYTLRERLAARIQEVAERYNKARHTPLLLGNPALFHHNLTFSAASASASRPPMHAPLQGLNAPAWFDRLLHNSKFLVTFEVAQPHKRFRLGELLNFTLQSSQDGYVNLVELEPNGKVQVLFPNKFRENNAIKANQRLAIPQDIGGFRLRAREPLGQSRLIALVTPRPLNLYQMQQGELLGEFKALTAEEFEKAARSVQVEAAPSEGAREHDFGAADVKFEIVR